jgi:hypothetical protein
MNQINNRKRIDVSFTDTVISQIEQNTDYYYGDIIAKTDQYGRVVDVYANNLRITPHPRKSLQKIETGEDSNERISRRSRRE